MIAVKGLSQDEKKDIFSFGAGYFYGNIYEHNPDISHLIKGHPTGLFLMFNKKESSLVMLFFISKSNSQSFKVFSRISFPLLPINKIKFL